MTIIHTHSSIQDQARQANANAQANAQAQSQSLGQIDTALLQRLSSMGTHAIFTQCVTMRIPAGRSGNGRERTVTVRVRAAVPIPPNDSDSIPPLEYDIYYPYQWWARIVEHDKNSRYQPFENINLIPMNQIGVTVHAIEPPDGTLVFVDIPQLPNWISTRNPQRMRHWSNDDEYLSSEVNPR